LFLLNITSALLVDPKKLVAAFTLFPVSDHESYWDSARFPRRWHPSVRHVRLLGSVFNSDGARGGFGNMKLC
jgi:hypothetical protein